MPNMQAGQNISADTCERLLFAVSEALCMLEAENEHVQMCVYMSIFLVQNLYKQQITLGPSEQLRTELRHLLCGNHAAVASHVLNQIALYSLQPVW